MKLRSVATILAEVVTPEGAAIWFDPLTRQMVMHEFTPPESFDTWQPGNVPVHIHHDGPEVGAVDYLETGYRYGNDGLFAVAVVQGVPAEMIDGLVMCSPEIRSNAVAGGGHATRSTVACLALVDKTAGITSTRVRAWPGDYRDPLFDRSRVPDIVRRAIEAAHFELRFRRPEQIRINRPRKSAPEERRYLPGASGRLEHCHSAPNFGGVLAVRSP